MQEGEIEIKKEIGKERGGVGRCRGSEGGTKGSEGGTRERSTKRREGERDTEKVSDRQISLFRTLPESKNLMQIRNGRSRGWEGEIIFHKNISNVMDMAGISTVIQKKNLQTSSYYQVLYILIRNIYPMTMCCVYIDLS